MSVTSITDSRADRDILITENMGLVHTCAHRFTGKGIYEVNELKNAQNTILKEINSDNIQAKIDLANNIEIIANSCLKQGNKATKGIKENRRREQIKRHIDYLKDV